MKKINKKKFFLGFTLIELLVAVSIIGILASLVFVSFSGAQKQTRDSQRKADTRQYQNALEIYANKNNSLYPSRAAVSGSRASINLCEADLLLSNCPEDTRYDEDNSFVYKYQSDGSGGGTDDATKYVLWAKLENSTDYWVVCSTGALGKVAQSGFGVSGGTCPL